MKTDFTRKLLEWNSRHNKRAMPWKGETDPFRIWLSEIILQQTRVEQGWFYYEKFIKTYPDIHSLAAAPEGDIYKMWEGLGYYSRCKNLIATAKIISDSLRGIFPSTYDEIIKLKGIGPYTAAAISSFAFNENRAVVDGNVQRVLARYFEISTPTDTTEGKKKFSRLAYELLDKHTPGIYNQAIMDFGATICRPRNPLCENCYLSEGCISFKKGQVMDLPVKQKTIKKKNRWLYYFIVENGDSVYIRKREGRDIWHNLHEFVLLETKDELQHPAENILPELLQHQTYTLISESELHSQQLTHQRINGKFIRIRVHRKPPLNGNYIEVQKSNLHEYAFPKFINSFLEKCLF